MMSLKEIGFVSSHDGALVRGMRSNDVERLLMKANDALWRLIISNGGNRFGLSRRFILALIVLAFLLHMAWR